MAQIGEIRKRYKKWVVGTPQLAKEYRVSKATILRIIHNERYRG
jgi:Mor family transcriptional regulator